jgi:hypothetical protein
MNQYIEENSLNSNIIQTCWPENGYSGTQETEQKTWSQKIKVIAQNMKGKKQIHWKFRNNNSAMNQDE